jgi:hypothetical protein
MASHTSAPLHASASPHDTPGVGVFEHPVVASHASAVHGLLSSHDTLVPMHVPAALHASPVVHALPSLQLAPTVGAFTQPTADSHESAVHAFPSLQTGGVPLAQTPAALQTSSPSQRSASAHETPGVGVFEHPVTASHASAVQGFPSSHETVVPMHAPAAVHASPLVHALASSQGTAGVGVNVQPVAGTQVLVVQAFASSHVRAVPPTQAPPALHVSPVVQRLPSSQAPPMGMGMQASRVQLTHAPPPHAALVAQSSTMSKSNAPSSVSSVSGLRYATRSVGTASSETMPG